MSEAVDKSGVCDVCNASISSPDGYLLTSRAVVSSPAYWQHYFRVHEGEFGLMGISSFDEFRGNVAVRTMCAEQLAGQRTPWMVCETCIPMFDVDREQARDYARRWCQSGGAFQPPGVGPAPLSAVRMGDAGNVPAAPGAGSRGATEVKTGLDRVSWPKMLIHERISRSG